MTPYNKNEKPPIMLSAQFQSALLLFIAGLAITMTFKIWDFASNLNSTIRDHRGQAEDHREQNRYTFGLYVQTGKAANAMKDFINKLLDGWEKSFNVTEQGYSRKKLVAYTFVILTAIIEIKWAYKTKDFQQLENVLIINCSIISAMLAVSAIEKEQLMQNFNSHIIF